MRTLATLAFEIPMNDSREFYGLPAATRDRVRWLLQCMRSIAAAPKKTTACQEIAEGAGMCFNAIYGIWRRFSETGDWRVLIDKRKTSEFWKRDETKVIELPADFITEWKRRCELNDRAMRPAHAQLVRDWKAWRAGDLTRAIPGYTRCPDPAPGGRLPRGWTYSNLLNYQPTDVELVAARKGRVEAKKLLPGIRTTRVGSYPFAEVQFDDMWHAFQVNVLGHKRAYRLLEFGAVDAFSTYIFKPGLKPRVEDMETGKMRALNERDFHLYAVNWLLDHGIHPDGTIMNAENGTARFSKAFQDRVAGIYGDKVTFVTGGMSGAPALPGGWSERAKGNPNAKALKEGLGKLIQGALGHLPGQTGKHFLDAPARLTGRSQENEMLLALAAVVPGLREKLQLGFLDLAEAVHAVNSTYEALNMRDDHAIEGWSECGLVIDEFRFSKLADEWRPLDDTLALEDHERELLALTLRLDPSLRRRRNLSPAECLLAHRTRLIRPPHEAVADLLGPEYGEKQTVRDGVITFTRPDTGKLRFNAKYQDAGGYVRRLDNGTEILAHLNPWKPEWLWLSDLRSGRFIGRAPRDLTPTRGDLDAIRSAHGRAEADYLDAVREVASRHGATRIPHLKANTAALRTAARPDARSQSLSAGFDASELLETSEIAGEPADTAVTFDPADLL
jgi:hypothetical protein